jgi:aldose 1-epimerase
MQIEHHPWGIARGEPARLFTLTNDRNESVGITDFGCTIVRLEAADRAGVLADVVLGYPAAEGLEHDPCFFGSVAGRFANRIAGGRFTLDGHPIVLATNDGPNHLHGGRRGFNQYPYDAETVEHDQAVGLRLSRTSPHGEEGYPGNLSVEVNYRWDNTPALTIEYSATTDAPTILNLTNHAYFNLGGHDAGSILDHSVQLIADRVVPVHADLSPLGTLAPVKGTPLDFTMSQRIGSRIDDPHDQLKRGRGYDHCYVVNGDFGVLRRAARVVEPGSGRVMEVETTQPGVQFYTGNFLDGSSQGKEGASYPHRSGFCLETQHFPDSPNHSGFPSTVLRPGETFRETTVYRFGTA